MRTIGLRSWLAEFFGKKPVSVGCITLDELRADLCIREMAFWSAVNLIANAVSKCEIKTFLNGVENKGHEYYLWNVQPNQNQSSSAFMHKLISQLCRNNECLVVENNGQLLIADSFIQTPYVLYETLYTEVAVGDFTFTKTFSESEVLYFKLSEHNMRVVTAALYDSYSKLIAYFMSSYQRSRGQKAVFEYVSLPPAGTEQRQAFDDLINNRFKQFLEGDNAIIPIGNGQKLQEFGDKKTYSRESTRDVRAMIDDISDFTAKAFGIPPALLRGDVQGVSDALDQFLTFCIDPLCDMLQEEIIRKRIGRAAYLKGTRVQFDTKAIKHVDLLNVSASIDKLISSGAFCINDIRELVGEPRIEEDWANEHFITRNYMPFEEALKGGE